MQIERKEQSIYKFVKEKEKGKEKRIRKRTQWSYLKRDMLLGVRDLRLTRSNYIVLFPGVGLRL